MAVLTFYGLVSVLILWRAFKLEKTDRAHIAATQSQTMEDSEQKTSWDERVKGAVAYACGEVIGYFVLGVMWLLYNMVGSLWTFAGVAAILCGVVIVVLAVNTIILDDAG